MLPLCSRQLIQLLDIHWASCGGKFINNWESEVTAGITNNESTSFISNGHFLTVWRFCLYPCHRRHLHLWTLSPSGGHWARPVCPSSCLPRLLPLGLHSPAPPAECHCNVSKNYLLRTVMFLAATHTISLLSECPTRPLLRLLLSCALRSAPAGLGWMRG